MKMHVAVQAFGLSILPIMDTQINYHFGFGLPYRQ